MILGSFDYGVRLITSLAALRQWYDGNVTVFVTKDDAEWIGLACARDDRLRCDISLVEPVGSAPNGHYVLKSHCAGRTPYQRTLLLDADTVCVGPINELLACNDSDLCVTRFASWSTNDSPVRDRILEWLNLPDRQLCGTSLNAVVLAALRRKVAINSGVVSYGRNSQLVSLWPELTAFGRDCTLCDEIALQLLITRVYHRIVDQRYNCSPVFSPTCDDVRIWHFHGCRHLETALSRSLWLPLFRYCLDCNIANIRRWWRDADPVLRTA